MSYLRGVSFRLKMDTENRRLPWEAFLLLSLLVSSCSSRGQLIGSRGVFVLPEGQEYRDATTREASRTVGQFALHFQDKVDKKVKKKYKKQSQARAMDRAHTPFFGPQLMVKGRAKTPDEVLDFHDSRSFRPPLELRMNKILEEVELERLQLKRGQKILMEDMLRPPNSAPQEDMRIPQQFPMFQAVQMKQQRNPNQFTRFESDRKVTPPPSHFAMFEAVPTPKSTMKNSIPKNTRNRKKGRQGKRPKKKQRNGIKANSRQDKNTKQSFSPSFMGFSPMPVPAVPKSNMFSTMNFPEKVIFPGRQNASPVEEFIRDQPNQLKPAQAILMDNNKIKSPFLFGTQDKVMKPRPRPQPDLLFNSLDERVRPRPKLPDDTRFRPDSFRSFDSTESMDNSPPMSAPGVGSRPGPRSRPRPPQPFDEDPKFSAIDDSSQRPLRKPFPRRLDDDQFSIPNTGNRLRPLTPPINEDSRERTLQFQSHKDIGPFSHQVEDSKRPQSRPGPFLSSPTPRPRPFTPLVKDDIRASSQPIQLPPENSFDEAQRARPPPFKTVDSTETESVGRVPSHRAFPLPMAVGGRRNPRPNSFRPPALEFSDEREPLQTRTLSNANDGGSANSQRPFSFHDQVRDNARPRQFSLKTKFGFFPNNKSTEEVRQRPGPMQHKPAPRPFNIVETQNGLSPSGPRDEADRQNLGNPRAFIPFIQQDIEPDNEHDISIKPLFEHQDEERNKETFRHRVIQREPPTAQPIFQVFSPMPDFLDLSSNSIDDEDRQHIFSSSPAPGFRHFSGHRGHRRKHPRKKLIPFHHPFLGSTPRPAVFDRTPSSLTDVNSDVISSNVFGRGHVSGTRVEGPNYSISWG